MLNSHCVWVISCACDVGISHVKFNIFQILTSNLPTHVTFIRLWWRIWVNMTLRTDYVKGEIERSPQIFQIITFRGLKSNDFYCKSTFLRGLYNHWLKRASNDFVTFSRSALEAPPTDIVLYVILALSSQHTDTKNAYALIDWYECYRRLFRAEHKKQRLDFTLFEYRRHQGSNREVLYTRRQPCIWRTALIDNDDVNSTDQKCREMSSCAASIIESSIRSWQ